MRIKPTYGAIMASYILAMAHPHMTKETMLAALAALGAQLPRPATVVLAGGAALLLTGEGERDTRDVDVIEANPELKKALKGLDLSFDGKMPKDWINDDVKLWKNLLPQTGRPGPRTLAPWAT